MVADYLKQFMPEGVAILTEKIIFCIIIIIVGLLAIRLLRSIIMRFAKMRLNIVTSRADDNAAALASKKKSDTVVSMMTSVSKYVIYFFILAGVLSVFGVGESLILAIGGIGSVAIGFASQGLAKDMINGTSILVMDHFNIGDIVEICGVRGKVTSLGLSKTIITTDNGNVHIIPNSEIKVIVKVNTEENNKNLAK